MPKPVPFETALRDLEDIIKHLERGDLPLEEALKNYEKGVQLIRQCQNTLTEAEQKIEILHQDSLKNAD